MRDEHASEPSGVGSPLRILHLTAYWPNQAAPTEAIFVREHVRAAATRTEAAVLYLAREEAERSLVDVVRGDDPELCVGRVRYRRFGRPLSYLALAAGTIRAYRGLARGGFRPDVIHAHQLVAALPALLLGRVYRVPVAYTEHWTIFLPENPFPISPATRLAAKFAIGRANIVLPVSHAWRRAVEALGMHGRFHVVPNVVDTELFRPSGRKRERHPSLRLLSVGHMDERAKGIDLLLRAVARLRSRGTAVELDLVGDGEGREEYEALARTLGVSDAVRFQGLLPKERVAALMRGADLFVLASRFENSPCVLIEATAAGLPVVATEVGGVAELVTADTGVLAPPEDADAFADAIERAASALDTFDADAMSRAAASRFSIDAVGRALAQVYVELVTR